MNSERRDLRDLSCVQVPRVTPLDVKQNLAGSCNKTDIIFALLPAYLEPVARVFRKFGHKVFYIKLSYADYPLEAERQRAYALREAGIMPLPLEDLPRLVGIRAYISDPEGKLQERNNKLAPTTLLQAFEALYPNNPDIVTKLHAVFQTIAAGHLATANQVNRWAEAHPGRKHLLIYSSVNGLLIFDLASNVRLLVVPVDLFIKAVVTATRILRAGLGAITAALTPKGHRAITVPPGSRNFSVSRVAFVTHDGLNYGQLYQKTLFYSDRTDSERHPENLLHFDYCGVSSPSEKIKWVCLGSQRQALFRGLYHAFVALTRGIFRIRRIQQAVGLLLLARFYAVFMSYSKQLAAYPDLKLALIDYELLCPKELLLAFDARKIKTAAAQERFVTTFFAISGSVLDTYLCASEYAAGVMKKSPSYCIGNYVPIGQHRSDYLIMARQSPPPQTLEVPLLRGRRIVTALGFHTHLDWYNSQADPLLNWTAHRQFLEDMIRLSRDMPNVFIVLRFKFVDWVSLPAFADVVREIETSEDMTISMDYEISHFSAELCAHSHLVISKHTSLGDECLAVGIPVLFHEYTHNTERLVADTIDYSPTRIMCFNYQELLERSRTILSGDPNAMTPDYEYLKNVVFGGLGDGGVRERIHAHIDSMLA